MAYVLGVALIGAAAAGFAFDRAHRQSGITNEPAAAATAPAPAAPQDDTNGSALTGKVLKTIDVPNYTYLRLDTGSAKVWAAVPSVKVDKGSTVTVANAMKMEQFRSKTLKRTFDVIYFGSIGDGAANTGSGNLPPGHPAIGNGTAMAGGATPGMMPQGHPQVGNSTADPDPTNLPKVDKAKGKNAERIGDVYASRDKLAGKVIRVRGVVVKVTPGVQGKTFLHLRDGSGDASKHENDLAATTQAVPKRGDVITLEGTLGTDVDIGIGYHYPVLLQNAKVLKD